MSEDNKEEPIKTSDNKPERDEKGRLLPGNTANLNGRPKFSLVGILKDILKEVPEGEKATVAEVLMREAVKKSLKGDTFMLRDIINRVDGMPKQTMGFDVDDVITELNITIKPRRDDSKPGVNNSVPEKPGAIPEKEIQDNN